MWPGSTRSEEAEAEGEAERIGAQPPGRPDATSTIQFAQVLVHWLFRQGRGIERQK